MPGGREDLPTEPYEVVVERRIRDLVEQGYFDNLPGAGKPLDLTHEDNPFVPPDLRMAYHILRNAGVSLPWIGLGNEVESDLSELRRRADAHESRVRATVGRIRLSIPGVRARQLASLRAEYADFLERFERAAAVLNRKIDTFSISVPVGIPQKPRFRPEPTLQRPRELLPLEDETSSGDRP